MKNDHFPSEDQRDTLSEIVNLGVGGAAEVLYQMTGEFIDLSVPSVYSVSPANVEQKLKIENLDIVTIQLDFTGSVLGKSAILLPKEDAIKLAGLLQGEKLPVDAPEAEWSETVTEVGNIIVNSVLGALANNFEEELTYKVPQYSNQKLEVLIQDTGWDELGCKVLVSEAQIDVKSVSVYAKILIIFSVNSINTLAKRLDQIFAESA